MSQQTPHLTPVPGGREEPAPEDAETASSPETVDAVPSASDEIRLAGDRLVVRMPEDGERQSRSGLLIPATAAQAPRRCVWATVLLTGPDVRTAKPGDRVLFLPQVGLEVEVDGEDQVLLRERDLQAVSSPGEGSKNHPGQYL